VTARQRGLGRGLTALIPTGDAIDGSEDVYREVPVDAIHPNPNQPRTAFDEAALVTLTKSVAELGILQPLLVREERDGYELIAGERRWRAAQRARLSVVPVIVRRVDDGTSLIQAVVENIHRHDLHALEEAGAYRQLLDDFGLTHDQLATRVGKSRSAISNTLRLLQLPPEVQRLVADGAVSAGHARALLACDDPARQQVLARRIVAEGLSVRAVEELVRDGAEARSVRSPGARGSRPSGADHPAAVLELEQLLSEHLSTGVTIRTGTGKGQLVIDFATLEDLERIYRIINPAA
jgi:ParB family chromosome partitioning protein